MASLKLIPILIAASLVVATVPAKAADLATCSTEARQWAASVPHLTHRAKVPLWTIVGTLIGGPRTGLWMAVLAANAESPRERRMIQSYENWCAAGKVGPAPQVPARFWELF